MKFETRFEIEAALTLLRTYLRTALMVAGNLRSSPAESRVAGNEVSRLKLEIAELEQKLEELPAAA